MTITTTNHHSAHHHGASHGGGQRCESIADGTVVTSEGEPVTFGFDEWGYNYQARLFIGATAMRGAARARVMRVL